MEVVQSILKIILQLIVIFTCWYYEWFGENSMLAMTLLFFVISNFLLFHFSDRIYIKKLSLKQREALSRGSAIMLTKKDIENT